MDRRHIVALGCALASACGGSAPAPRPDTSAPDSGPEIVGPPACTVVNARALGSSTGGSAYVPIRHEPAGAIAGDAIVTRREIAGTDLVLEATIAGEAHRFVIGDALEEPPLELGAEIAIDFAVQGYPLTGEQTYLVLRDGSGVVAAWARSAGIDYVSRDSAGFGEAIGVPLSAEPACRHDAGGQCGRGLVRYDVIAGEVRIAEGASATIAAGLVLTTQAAVDDADLWFDGTVCAIGTLHGLMLDVRRE